MKLRPFYVFANGCSGTTFLKNILDSHPEVVCDSETGNVKRIEEYIAIHREKHKATMEAGKIYGNKMPIEMVCVRNIVWPLDAFYRMAYFGFKLVYIQRDFEGYMETWNKWQKPEASRDQLLEWRRIAEKMADDIKTDFPGLIHFVSYEALVSENASTEVAALQKYLNIKKDDGWKEIISSSMDAYPSQKRLAEV